MDRMKFRFQLDPLLSPEYRRLFLKLNTPQKVQDFLDHFPVNVLEEGEHTMRGPVEMLKAGKAHCMEGALFAAVAFAYHNSPPLLLDLQSTDDDLDHVVALFKQNGLWGAVSKTNHPVLRWRDPVYKTVRELALSYFHEYFMDDGVKTLHAYSRPFDLSKFKPEAWVTADGDLDWLAEALDDSPHSPIFPTSQKKFLRRASKIEIEATVFEEWSKTGKKKF